MPAFFIRIDTEPKDTTFLVLITSRFHRTFGIANHLTTSFMKVSITSTELEIIRKSADGFTVKQIAKEMNVSQVVISKSQKEILVRTGTGDSLNALLTLAKHGFTLTREHF
jgi:DNA-binding NarL/FixJ family response regulator